MCFSQAPESTFTFSFGLFLLASLRPPYIVNPQITYLQYKYAKHLHQPFFSPSIFQESFSPYHKLSLINMTFSEHEERNVPSINYFKWAIKISPKIASSHLRDKPQLKL
jgi:hypothetical protein